MDARSARTNNRRGVELLLPLGRHKAYRPMVDTREKFNFTKREETIIMLDFIMTVCLVYICYMISKPSKYKSK